MMPKSAVRYLIIGAVLLFLLLFIPERAVRLMWLDALGFSQIFWKLALTKLAMFAAMFVAVLAFFGVNFAVMLRRVPVLQWLHGDVRRPGFRVGEVFVSMEHLKWLVMTASLFVALLFAAAFAAQWEAYLLFAGAEPAGSVDPLFGHDISFYLLSLPFIQALQGFFVGASLLNLVAIIAVYVMVANVRFERGRVRAPRAVIIHIGVNLILVLLGWAAGTYLARYEVLYASGGTVFGAGYADVNVLLPALWVMIAATAGLIALVAFSMISGRAAPLVLGLIGYVVLSVLGRGVAPALVQKFSVEPNELQMETPYLEHNIAMTRQAYQLDKIVEREYPARTEITAEQVRANRETLQNIRLWDPRLLIQTYKQLQEIRLYYEFYQVDVDRYEVGGRTVQVMLSARELAQSLPQRSDTWLNRHLVFTHGYGVTMNHAAETGPEGTPPFLIQDIPPVSRPEIPITQSAIYYGEHTPTYRIVRTNVRELDYPQGDDNVYTQYNGTGGVRLGGFFTRLLFAWYLSDFNIIISDAITAESRVQFWNSLQERIRQVAPFLYLDQDPYLVISEGRLVWIQDAYTMARTYPYSEPIRNGANYVRSSVKVVVDAYHGTVHLYAMEPDEPVLRAYRKAFPDAFRDMAEMPEELVRHLRYPQDLFALQVEKYNRYHMESPQTFYNNEDLWTIPREQYGGRAVEMEPYYVLTKMPGEPDLQFMLMTPLTPQGRDNMIAWIAARSDMPGYGEIVVYKLPKERLIYGPNQVESRIDQDTEISQLLALWDQRGSRVIRGNLMAIPVDSSFLYVEPVFLIAEGTQIPQLQRVIVSLGERVVMERTLEEAVRRVIGVPIARDVPEIEVPDGATPPTGVPAPELARIREGLDRALRALQEGDFSTFGAQLDALQRLLEE